MALLSLAMVCYLKPSSAIFAETLVPREGLQSHIPINGLLIPSSINSVSGVSSNAISYLSMKVKVGHQRVEDDAIAVMLEECMFGQMATEDRTNLMLNNFTQLLGKHDLHWVYRCISPKGEYWGFTSDFERPVEALENWYDILGIKYASDESMAEAVHSLITADPKPCHAIAYSKTQKMRSLCFETFF